MQKLKYPAPKKESYSHQVGDDFTYELSDEAQGYIKDREKKTEDLAGKILGIAPDALVENYKKITPGASFEDDGYIYTVTGKKNNGVMTLEKKFKETGFTTQITMRPETLADKVLSGKIREVTDELLPTGSTWKGEKGELYTIIKIEGNLVTYTQNGEELQEELDLFKKLINKGTLEKVEDLTQVSTKDLSAEKATRILEIEKEIEERTEIEEKARREAATLAIEIAALKKEIEEAEKKAVTEAVDPKEKTEDPIKKSMEYADRLNAAFTAMLEAQKARMSGKIKHMLKKMTDEEFKLLEKKYTDAKKVYEDLQNAGIDGMDTNNSSGDKPLLGEYIDFEETT